MTWKKSVMPKSVYRRQLAARLRELREDSELTLAEVSGRVEVSAGSLSRIETGDRGTTPVLVKALLDCYGVNDEAVREDILDLVRADQARKRPWWKKYAAVVNTTQYGGYLTLESSAVSMRSYEPLLIPGLLQTEDYARAIITEMRSDLTARQVEALVKVRLRRQELLRGEAPPKLWVVIDEAAIRRHVGSAEVMRQQIEHLLATCEQPHVTMQFLAFELGGHAGLYGSFVLMDFPNPTPEVVWTENLTNSVCFEDPKDVERYADVFDHLRARALGPSETRRRFRELSKELE
ncbi:helix-turn-helix transcriptional regulator [Streptomyces sp. NBS 14/10]|uniref:helix-turn-helix domain-containing protein n=1 Tax=Streptomyces sp. NBS 14/10 TaxID=1945643 RepID=UPI00211AFD0D|nr:helix-turn-helix transcriptional regulator [Streptomyces sp. NBS 14/10]KAK1182537.1 helix-turn-helix transcriptional regulator [Streptomyces sp. NBS 14/10]